MSTREITPDAHEQARLEREVREWNGSAHEGEDWCAYHGAPEPCFGCVPGTQSEGSQCCYLCGFCGRCS